MAEIDRQLSDLARDLDSTLISRKISDQTRLEEEEAQRKISEESDITFKSYTSEIQESFLKFIYGPNFKSINSIQEARITRPVTADPTVICIWKTILEVLEKRKEDLLALQAIHSLVKEVRKELKDIDMNFVPAYISIDAACDLFNRFLGIIGGTLTSEVSLSEGVLSSGDLALKCLSQAQEKLCRQAQKFIKNGSKILIHGNSKCVMNCICHLKNATIYLTSGTSAYNEVQGTAAGKMVRRNILEVRELHEQKIRFNCPSRRSESLGCKAGNNLKIQIIPDTAVAFYMSKVDFCLVGAEGVIENGGIINQIGTFQMALLAKQFNKPFYCASESFKFMRFYPLCQEDLRNPEKGSPLVDMTPHELISLFLTDLGVLTPGEVCDNLIKLYTD